MLEELLANQPSANDLIGCDEFLRKLHSLMATNSEYIGHLETQVNLKLLEILKDESCKDDIKILKTSSTMFMNYVYAKCPDVSKELIKCKHLQKVAEVASNDYRTLISSFKRSADYV